MNSVYEVQRHKNNKAAQGFKWKVKGILRQESIKYSNAGSQCRFPIFFYIFFPLFNKADSRNCSNFYATLGKILVRKPIKDYYIRFARSQSVFLDYLLSSRLNIERNDYQKHFEAEYIEKKTIRQVNYHVSAMEAKLLDEKGAKGIGTIFDVQFLFLFKQAQSF